MKALTSNEFITRAKKIYEDGYDYSLVNYINSNTKVKIICHEHGEFEKHPLKFLNGRECSKCKSKQKRSTKKLTTNGFIEKSKIIHGNKYNYSKANYVNNRTKIILICEKHGDFEIVPNYHLSDKCGCQKCAKESIVDKNTITKYEFIKKAKLIHGDKYDYSKIKYKNISTKIDIICKKHGSFKQTPLHHIHSKSGCPKCGHNIMAKKTKITTKIFIERANKIHNNKYNYTLSFVNGTDSIVKIICPKHGEFKQKAMPHMIGQGCPICKESKGERIIRNWLIDNNIKFERQKKFKDCKNKRKLPFDFYLPIYNMCIEYNGTQHYKMSTYFGQKSFEQTQINDKIKKEFCENNNIKLLIIKYNDNISNHLNNSL